MNIIDILPTIVKTGKYVYSDKHYRFFICQSNIYPGTGDCEDDFEIREDREIYCFTIWFESTAVKDTINSNGGYYLTLNETIDAIEKIPGFIKWI